MLPKFYITKWAIFYAAYSDKCKRDFLTKIKMYAYDEITNHTMEREWTNRNKLAPYGTVGRLLLTANFKVT